ncbi:hypothetical protein BOCO_1063 [Bombiscardovia coagulans]|uniref:Uncharacterized protein n=1 Tax=Bombiscardovia coagulans TaxID=686666 RepID=A0A261EQZ1_9BIFI|nr:hypothetical protein BOCO_1063 [Bombiscardovia coagulans]
MCWRYATKYLLLYVQGMFKIGCFARKVDRIVWLLIMCKGTHNKGAWYELTVRMCGGNDDVDGWHLPGVGGR